MARGSKGGGSGDSTGAITGNKRDNVLNGTSADDVIDGRDGHDTLFGLGGADTLFGGNGNDRLIGGAGNDIIDGGTGTDTAVFSGARDLYTVTTLTDGSIQISGPDGTDTLTGVEFFEFADMTQTAAEVIVPRLANLSATSLTLTDTALAPGEGSTVSFVLASDGTIDAGASSYELVLAPAPDADAIISVIDSGNATDLATGQSATLSATIAADTLAPGTYWVAVRADSGNALTESDEGDNLTNWVQITVEAPVADLTLTGATLGGATDLDLAGGGLLEITYDYANVGNTGPNSFTIQTYLSTDGTISADDTRVLGISGGTYPGLSRSTTTSYTLQADFPAGDYYLISMISWGDGSADATPENNTVVQQITLVAPPTDLAITGLTIDPASDLLADADGVALTFNVDLANLGALAASSGLTAYLSTDGTASADDIALDLGAIGITAGGSASVNGTFTLAPGTAAGDYTLIVVLDSDDTPDNNSASIGITITAPPPAITGTQAGDTLTGTSGDDVIEALGGDDFVFATTGADRVDGGAGFDTADFSGLTAGIQIDDFEATEGFVLRDHVDGEASQTYTGFEAIVGTAFDDRIEIIEGAALHLDLGDGNDLAVTGAGDDVIDLGAGDDAVIALAGNDTIILGEGSDIFGVLLSGNGHDVVTDFNVAEDYIMFGEIGVTPYNPLADAAQTADGTLLSYADGASILLLGVDLNSLGAENFLFEELMMTM